MHAVLETFNRYEHAEMNMIFYANFICLSLPEPADVIPFDEGPFRLRPSRLLLDTDMSSPEDSRIR